MGKFDSYIERARAYLKMPGAEVLGEPPLVWVVGGVRDLPADLRAGKMNLHGNIWDVEISFPAESLLYDHVAIFEGKLSTGHEEAFEEAVKNIGDLPIVYHLVCSSVHDSIIIDPGSVIKSVANSWNRDTYPSFEAPQGEAGVLYVVKALRPEFRDGPRFPERVYRGLQP